MPPEAPLTPQERTLQVFCRIFAVVYALGAIGFATTPRLTFRLITLDRAPAVWDAQAAFWNVLACAMMTAIATACGVVSGRPRERRHALLPVVVAKITSSALAAMHLVRMGGSGSMALIVVIATDFPLFIVTLLVYRAAAPGVHSAPAREGPPVEAEQPKVQLGISKAN